MIAQKQAELTFPVRWWSFGPFWRYERPQRGRTREFFQWNVDLLGADSPEADAENVAVLATFLERVGLQPTQVQILVNDRRLLDGNFDKLGIQGDQRTPVSGWIDRRSKMAKEAWQAEGRAIGLESAQLSGIEGMLEDREQWKTSSELRRFFAAVAVLGFERYVQFDPSIVRGLTYYTGTVFEAWEMGGDIRRSLLGGGRYDNLLADVGGAPLPAVGFALGDVVMALLLEKYGLLPKDLDVFPASVLVTLFDEAGYAATFRVAAALRKAGLRVAAYPQPDKLARQFKYADKTQARLAIILGPDETSAGQVAIKDMHSGEQVTVAESAAAEVCRGLLEATAAR
jgi:histidyl-tRNA synthetase